MMRVIWTRLTVRVRVPLQITAALTSYAYETIPDKSIIPARQSAQMRALGA